jgi:lysophospholipase L1-like esterase
MGNICIFGDSITWGAQLSFRVGWANLFRNYLEGLSGEFFAVYDLGIDGNTSDDLIDRFDVEAKARSPEIIFFAIGTNDSCFHKTKDNSEVSIEDFENNLNKLILKARKFTENIIFIGLVKGDDKITFPLIRSTTGKCYKKENIKMYDSVIRKVCDKESLLFIDVNNNLNDLDFDDGLHPNVIGHMKIFEEVRRNLDKIIK